MHKQFEIKKNPSEMMNKNVKQRNVSESSESPSAFILMESVKMLLDEVNGKKPNKEAAETLNKCVDYLKEASTLLESNDGNDTGNDTASDSDSAASDSDSVSSDGEQTYKISSSGFDFSSSADTLDSIGTCGTGEIKAIKAIAGKTSNLDWDDIVGSESVKKALKESIVWPQIYPGLFSPITDRKPWKGIFLYGPKGTGKCTMAKIAAAKANATFVYVNPYHLVCKFGEQAKMEFDKLVTLAKENQPSVIFLDELEHFLMTNREKLMDFNDYMKAILQDIYNSNDDINYIGGKNTLFDDVRTGLGWVFSKKIQVQFPNKTQRKLIFEKELKQFGCKATDEALLSFAQLTKPRQFIKKPAKCIGFSGGDIHKICTEAALASVSEEVKAETWIYGNAKPKAIITKENLEAAVKNYSLVLYCYFGVRPMGVAAVLSITPRSNVVKNQQAMTSAGKIFKGSRSFPFFKLFH